MAWLRLYDGILDDPKIQMLSDRAFRMLVNLWCLAKRRGGVVPHDESALSFSLRMQVQKVRDTLQILISAKLIERVEGGYKPHDWDVHQYQSDVSTERVKQFRERQSKRDETVSETSPDTETEQKQTQKQEVVRANARRAARLKTAIPDHFPADADRRRAQEAWSKKGRPDLAASVMDEIEKFRDHHTASGKTSADWAASWRTWIKNAPGYTPRQRMNGHEHRESPLQQSERIAQQLIREEARDEGANPGPDRVPRIALRPTSDER